MNLHRMQGSVCRDRFEIGPVVLVVQANNVGQLSCLYDYLTPYTAAGHQETQHSPIHVDVYADTAFFDELHNESSRNTMTDSFLHHPDTLYTVHRLIDGTDAFLAKTGYPHIILRVSDDHYVVVHPDDNDPEGPKPALRLVREIIVARLEGPIGATIHASAAMSRDLGVLFVGDTGAGKTTCAMAMALEPEGVFVSGDRSIILHDASAPAVAGWPMAVNVGAGALEAFLTPASREVPNVYRNAYFDHYYADRPDAALAQSQRKLAFTPAEFERLCEINFQIGTRLNAIVFPRINDASDTSSRLRRVSKQASVDSLCRELRIGKDSGHGYGLVARDYDPTQHQADTTARIEALAKILPCFNLDLSYGALGDFFAGRNRLSDVIRGELAHA